MEQNQINNKLLQFSRAYYIRLNCPKNWKLCLSDINEFMKNKDFLLWYYSKKDEIYKYHERINKIGIQVTFPGDENYPQSFLNKLDDAPLLLFYIGQPIWKTHQCLSVVGSRKITTHSKKWIDHELYQFLLNNNSLCSQNLQQKIIIVSGGARGVDQEAHYQALRLSLPTIVVLPSGVSNMYPSELNEWSTDVLNKGGVFISEYFPNELMKSYHFIQRNRLIATLCVRNCKTESFGTLRLRV